MHSIDEIMLTEALNSIENMSIAVYDEVKDDILEYGLKSNFITVFRSFIESTDLPNIKISMELTVDGSKYYIYIEKKIEQHKLDVIKEFI